MNFSSEKLKKSCDLLTFNFCYKRYFYNFVIIIAIMLNLSVFFFYVWNGMLCTKYSIVFSLENSFPIVLSGEV